MHYFSKPKDIIISVKSKTFRLNLQLPSSHFTSQKNTTPRLPISMSPAVLFMVCHLSAHLPKINIENTQLAWVDSMVPKKLEPKNNQTTNIKHTIDKRTQSALKLIFFFLGLVWFQAIGAGRVGRLTNGTPLCRRVKEGVCFHILLAVCLLAAIIAPFCRVPIFT